MCYQALKGFYILGVSRNLRPNTVECVITSTCYIYHYAYSTNGTFHCTLSRAQECVVLPFSA